MPNEGTSVREIPVSHVAQGSASVREPMSWTRLGWCLAVAGVLVAVDLWSKAAVFAWLGDPATHAALPRDACGHAREPVLGGWLALMLNLNYGAAFGRLSGIPHVLVVGRIFAVLLLVWLLARAPRAHRLYLTALVLILAGAVGNLYDNFFFAPGSDHIPRANDGMPFGPVRDFIDVYFPVFDWHFPTFNFADSCITVGAVVLLLSGLAPRRAAEPAPPALSAP